MSDAPLAIRSPEPIEPWRDPDWQRLWLSLQTRSWRSMAVIPAGPGVPADFTLRISVMLSRTGMLHLGAPIHVADATSVQLAHLSGFIEDVRRCTTSGDMILVAMSALQQNPVSLSLAKSVDAALLCVAMEQMELGEAKKTVAQVGADRFMGSAVFHSAESLASVPAAPR